MNIPNDRQLNFVNMTHWKYPNRVPNYVQIPRGGGFRADIVIWTELMNAEEL